MTHESLIANEWLYAVLANDATLAALVENNTKTGDPNVYDTFGDADATYPLLAFEQVESSDEVAIGAIRVLSVITYEVVAVEQSENYTTNQAAIAARADVLLHGQQGTTDNGLIVSCVRSGPIAQRYVAEGLPFTRLGGKYTLRVQSF